MFASFERRAQVAQRAEERRVYLFRDGDDMPRTAPASSHIALDWNFQDRCFESLEFGPPHELLERYFSDLRSVCSRQAKT